MESQSDIFLSRTVQSCTRSLLDLIVLIRSKFWICIDFQFSPCVEFFYYKYHFKLSTFLTTFQHSVAKFEILSKKSCVFINICLHSFLKLFVLFFLIVPLNNVSSLFFKYHISVLGSELFQVCNI